VAVQDFSRFGSLAPLGGLDVGPLPEYEKEPRHSIQRGINFRSQKPKKKCKDYINCCTCLCGKPSASNLLAISNGPANSPETLTVEVIPEHMTCCCNLCCPIREWIMRQGNPGDKALGALAATYTQEKVSASTPAPCKCCCECIPGCAKARVTVKDAKDMYIGQAVETCWYCTVGPEFQILDAKDDKQFDVRMDGPSCPAKEFCGQCLVSCCAACTAGLCNFPNPCMGDPLVSVYDKNGNHVGRFLDLPMVNEVWTTGPLAVTYQADAFKVQLPPGADPHTIARVIAAAFLVETMFKGA